MTSPTVVELEDVSVEYHLAGETVIALDRVSMNLVRGSAVVIEGPSGAGKSTLLRVLGRVQAPTSGAVSFPLGGVAMTVFQDHLLVPFLTLSENVRLAAELHNEANATAEAVSHYLDLVGIAELAGRLPEEVSGGQRQRAAVAQAMVVEPALLLADEPTGSLDQENSGHLARLLSSLAAETGTAVVVATHSPIVTAAFPAHCEMTSGQLTC
jgi:ABC-type lipoprotein export system ATPase subunit